MGHMTRPAALAASPYRLDGPTIIAFSGGRTSGYMLRQILDAHDGVLPHDTHVAFCNTGKEMPATLDFVKEVSERWAVPITWLEYRYRPGQDGADGSTSFEIVNHNSASRQGEPFDQVIQAHGYLPNPVTRFCSAEMKIKTTSRWVRAVLGWDEWTSVVGLRADERHRVARQRARNDGGRERYQTAMPLADAGITKRDVVAFWASQPFDLRLPNVRGSTPAGNCDGCFLKAWPTIAGGIRDGWLDPEWWIGWESRPLGRSQPTTETFRSDRPSYARTAEIVRDQGDMIAAMADGGDAVDCACTD